MHKLLTILLVSLSLLSCSNDGKGTDTGSACEVVDDCYPNLDHDDLSGDALCLDRVEAGYCTHECETDADCCAAEGECEDGAPPQVCAPFESTGLRLCFLSCEGEPDDYCAAELSEDFGCRSTGGGSDNRKVCTPGG